MLVTLDTYMLAGNVIDLLTEGYHIETIRHKRHINENKYQSQKPLPIIPLVFTS